MPLGAGLPEKVYNVTDDVLSSQTWAQNVLHTRTDITQTHLPQIPALTGLRFFAAGFILVEHAADWLARFSDSNVRQYVTFLGMYGMPLFFVLSGFVIHYNYRKLFITRSIARATSEFAVARFARLFPLYFCLLIFAVCADNLVDRVQGNYTLFAKIMALYITLTQSWWYIVYDSKSIIYWLFGLSWSISTEMFFYAAYVATIFLLLLIKRGRTAVVMTIFYAAVTMGMLAISRDHTEVILSFAQRHIPDYVGVQDFDDSFYRWLFYISPYIRVFEFFMGCMTAHVFILIHASPVSSVEQRLANLALAIALLFLATCGLLVLGVVQIGSINQYVHHLYLNFLCAPAIAFLMFYVARYDTAFTKLLTWRMFLVLGDASYSIYLLHTWTLRILIRPAPVLSLVWGIDTIVRVICGIALTLITAWATYRLIEVPCRSWLRRRLGALVSKIFGDGLDTGTLSEKVLVKSPALT
jgi:peptidoglycan/LPS O-acetylase OafA/YrhL